MTSLLIEEILIFQVILQIMAAGMVTQLYRGWSSYSKYRRPTVYIMLALYLMVGRRITAIFDAYDLVASIDIIDKAILPVAISALIVKGIYELKKIL